MSKPAAVILQMSRAVMSIEGSIFSFTFKSNDEARSAFNSFAGCIGHAHHEVKANLASDEHREELKGEVN